MGRMVSLTSEKLASDQSQVVEDILTSENNGMGFFLCLCGLGACQNKWKWMSVRFAGCRQL